MPSGRSPFLRHPLASGLGIAGALLVCAEICLRLASPEIWRFVAEARRLHRYDPRWVVRLAPSERARFVLHRPDGSPLYDFEIKTDALACRTAGTTTGAAPASYVHALGDSFTMGWGVAGEASWPARLDGLLGGRGDVVNLGVDGFGAIAATGRSREMWAARPPRAAVYLFSPNDFDDDARATAEAARSPAVHAGKRVFDALRRRAWLANAPFVAVWWRRFRPSRAAAPAPPPAGGVLAEATPPASAEPEPPAATAAAVLAYRDFAASQGVRFILLALDAPESRRMVAFARGRGIDARLLDVPPSLFLAEGHLNEDGNRQLAALVARALAEGPAR